MAPLFMYVHLIDVGRAKLGETQMLVVIFFIFTVPCIIILG